ncbi:MAG TPA: Rne/Rng family ribonuclease, partial [Acidimicrobiales bacterium]|nr:Rne/Rng family ribonuclease [Acidimicrobiales bacterium]
MTDTPTADASGPTPEPPAADRATDPTPPTDTGEGPAADASPGGPSDEGSSESAAAKRRRRGSRGGRNRSRARTEGAAGDPDDGGPEARGGEGDGEAGAGGPDDRDPDLPDRHREGKPASVEAAAAALVPRAPRKPQIGDSMPAPTPAADAAQSDAGEGGGKRKRRRGGRGRGSGGGDQTATGAASQGDGGKGHQGKGGGRGRKASQPIEAVLPTGGVDLDDDILEARRGRERKGRPVGRYLMAVHKTDKATQIAVLEGRNLIEHYVSKPSDDVSQIHGNIYLGRVQNVLPGMEAAFVDISTPKNAVLYRGDVHFDAEDLEGGGKGGKSSNLRIEQMLKAKQTIICQVTKNPIGAKGARLTQEVSLPGRFVVLIPNSSTYGISKRLSDDERKRLRNILDKVKPKQHGVIVRTAAEGVTDQEIELDVRRLLDQWNQIDALAQKTQAPALLYREPDMAVRVIREEFNSDYRSVIIDDRELYESVRDYVASISPELADRVELYDRAEEPLPLYERLHIHEQLHKALDRKVWLPSGGSLIIEHTEALTVIDVNTGKNVGTSNLEETVFRNNLEAATEIARQLRLRDVGGIIVVDFIDM